MTLCPTYSYSLIFLFSFCLCLLSFVYILCIFSSMFHIQCLIFILAAAERPTAPPTRTLLVFSPELLSTFFGFHTFLSLFVFFFFLTSSKGVYRVKLRLTAFVSCSQSTVVLRRLHQPKPLPQWHTTNPTIPMRCRRKSTDNNKKEILGLETDCGMLQTCRTRAGTW